MKLADYLLEIQAFIQDYLKKSHQKGYVLGISGGIDSALVAALTTKAVGRDKLFALLMPIDSEKCDVEYGLELCHKFAIPYEVVDLSEPYHQLIAKFDLEDSSAKAIALNNTKVRLRMVTLYAYAQARNALVLGTDNADEIHVGYFTKYGDGAADLVPISRLTKREVYQASQMLGVPDSIIKRVPTAGLFSGQTDEGELGVTYEQLDRYLLGKEVPPHVAKRIAFLHRISEHKRKKIPRPKKFVRE